MEKILAQKAAEWWADFLRAGEAPLDNGDNSEVGAMTFILASLVQQGETLRGASDNADKFQAALQELLEPMDGQWVDLGVDYGPDYILLQAAERAGINLGMARLPWKTTMWIKDGKITVAIGYHGKDQQIYPEIIT